MPYFSCPPSENLSETQSCVNFKLCKLRNQEMFLTEFHWNWTSVGNMLYLAFHAKPGAKIQNEIEKKWICKCLGTFLPKEPRDDKSRRASRTLRHIYTLSRCLLPIGTPELMDNSVLRLSLILELLILWRCGRLFKRGHL